MLPETGEVAPAAFLFVALEHHRHEHLLAELERAAGAVEQAGRAPLAVDDEACRAFAKVGLGIAVEAGGGAHNSSPRPTSWRRRSSATTRGSLSACSWAKASHCF